jgi:hypothetical protein
MRKIKDVLRLKLDAKLSHRQIAAALGISKAAVTKYLGLAAAAGLDWASVQGVDEAALEWRLLVSPERPRDHVQPDYGRLHQELRRKGMTLMLLWEEHRADYAGRQTYGYTQFCENYRRFAKKNCNSPRARCLSFLLVEHRELARQSIYHALPVPEPIEQCGVIPVFIWEFRFAIDDLEAGDDSAM